MPRLEEIKKPVENELKRYEDFMRESLVSEFKVTREMLDYIFENRGKAIRPLMVLLSASMFSDAGLLPDKSLLTAMLVEMVHTASLVHDDVIDDSNMRRGKPSVKALWDSHRAVIIGDYILAKSYMSGMKHRAYDIVEYVHYAMEELCEGELLQSDQNERMVMTRDIYNTIIYKKTASLIGISSGAGAMSAGAGPDIVARMKDFGVNVGMAFQIRDDIRDYMPSSLTGKPLCSDLAEQKINLPLLMVMEASGRDKAERLKALLSGIKESPANINTLCSEVIDSGGLELASAEMDKYIAKAKECLAGFPASPYRKSLEGLCDYLAGKH